MGQIKMYADFQAYPKNVHKFCIPLNKISLFLKKIFCVFGSCFRMLAVNHVSDFYFLFF